MANNNTEIEIQVNVENYKPLIKFLKVNGNFQAEKHQIDEYFSPAYRDFLSTRPVAEWLRLRDDDGKSSINYKNWHFDENGKSYYCDEFETKIESIEQVRKILSALNFKSIVVVDKLRKIYMLNDYEVAIDSVKGLGDFVEVEYIGKDEKADPKKITEEMVDFLKKVGCGKITRNYVGYPFLLLFPEEAEYEEQ
ncbi:class IV adenylate cyclase [Candidatus Daviesbacteria bacterium]|nr:class IV adenylate cyclase [Candidatus Daviesbacteria bacterium]